MGEQGPHTIVAEAVDALIAGDIRGGERLLRSLDAPSLQAEMERARAGARPSAMASPATVSLVPQGARTPPPAIQVPMFRRDGYSCRYDHCQRKTILPPVFRALSLQYSDLLKWNKNWRGTHPVVWLYTTSVEHIIPWAESRSSHPEDNLITTCYWCNQIKSRRRRQELGWDLADPVPTSWQGLGNSLAALVSVVLARADGTARTYFNTWIRALGAEVSSTKVATATRARLVDAPGAPGASAKATTTLAPAPLVSRQITGDVVKGMVVQAVPESRVQARNYRVEQVTGGKVVGREFWYTGDSSSDGLCVYSQQVRVLAEVRQIHPAKPPIEGRRRSQQPPGAFLT